MAGVDALDNDADVVVNVDFDENRWQIKKKVQFFYTAKFSSRSPNFGSELQGA